MYFSRPCHRYCVVTSFHYASHLWHHLRWWSNVIKRMFSSTYVSNWFQMFSCLLPPLHWLLWSKFTFDLGSTPGSTLVTNSGLHYQITALLTLVIAQFSAHVLISFRSYGFLWITSECVLFQHFFAVLKLFWDPSNNLISTSQEYCRHCC